MTQNLFESNLDARRAVETTTGLSGDEVDRVMVGLSQAGVVPTLGPNADSEARYAFALNLLRAGTRSVRRAAIDAGLDPSNFRRRLIRLKEKIPDAEQRHRAAEERILTMAEDLSETAGAKLIDDVENNRLKPADLVKTFSAATNQVAAKRRWNQGLSSGADRTQDALTKVLEQLHAGASIRIEKPDPANSAIDITPSDQAGVRSHLPIL